MNTAEHWKEKFGESTRSNFGRRKSGPKSSFNRLYELPFFGEVYEKLRTGYSLSRIAKMIHGRGYCQDVTFGYLRLVLHNFRNKKIPPSEMVSGRVPGVIMDAEEKIKQGLDELEEMQKMYKMQLSRIGIDHEKEKAIGKLFNNTHKEVEVCLNILQASAKLKQSLGLTRNELGTVNVESKHILEAQDKYGVSGIQAIISNPSSRRKVLTLAQKLISGEVKDDECDDDEVIDTVAVPASNDIEE